LISKAKAAFHRLTDLIKKLMKKGFFHIFTGNILVKFVNMFSVLLLPRLLVKADYGLLAYADNIRNYLIIINGLGISNSVLRYCSITNDSSEKLGYYKLALKMGTLANVLITGISITSFLIIDFPVKGTKTILIMLAGYPLLFYWFECIQFYLRANLENKKFSFLTLTNAFTMVFLQIGFGWFFQINGIIIGRYISIFITITLSIYLLKRLPYYNVKSVLSEKVNLKQFFNCGFVMMLSNLASLMMPLNELFLVGNILKDNNLIADYRAASLLPQNLTLVAVSIAIFAFPHFARNSNNGKWIWAKYKKINFLLLILTIPLMLLLIVFSPIINHVIFGPAYSGAIPIMRILWVTYGVNTCFRVIAGNVLAAIGDTKFNFYNAFLSSILHLMLEIYMISHFGIYGSAWGLLIVYVLSSLAANIYLKNKCEKLERAEALEHKSRAGICNA